MKYLGLLLICLFSYKVVVATSVPHTLEFAGMTLELSTGVREKIQKDVDMILRNPTYFQQKVERANLHFPIIERIFREESFPSDFKFLCLQESSLIADAVSSSNAVGYWQFKKESAIEVGVRVNGIVDERMNLVASTRGAAKYLKRNNGYYKNWVYSLLSYNLGLGGAKSQAEEKYIGANHMKITEDMHWYVIRFLAHMVAYREAIGKSLHPQYRLEIFTRGQGKTLKQIAETYSLSVDEVGNFNKWALKGSVPADGDYSVILPMPHGQAFSDEEGGHQHRSKRDPVVSSDPQKAPVAVLPKNTKPSVVVTETNEVNSERATSTGTMLKLIMVNRVRAVLAREGDNVASLSFATGITMVAFRHFNEMELFDEVKAGKVYYIQLKRTRAFTSFHTVEVGETIWDIAQRYGIRTSSIRKMNRMPKTEALKAGRVLWLNTVRPKDVTVEYKILPAVVVKPTVKDSFVYAPVRRDTVIAETPKAPVAPVSQLRSDARKHTVIQGETMYSVARTYQVSVDSLLAWNQLEAYSLKVGQQLFVENPYVSAEIQHTVIQGETMYSISKKYGVSVDELKAWNNKPDNQLKLGEVLIIKPKP